MATSSIGMTTVVKREYADTLLKEIRRYKAMVRAKKSKSLGSISDIRAIGMRR